MLTVLGTEYLLFSLLSNTSRISNSQFNRFVSILSNSLPDVFIEVSKDSLYYAAYLHEDQIAIDSKGFYLTEGTRIEDIKNLASDSFNWMYTDKQNSTVQSVAKEVIEAEKKRNNMEEKLPKVPQVCPRCQAQISGGIGMREIGDIIKPGQIIFFLCGGALFVNETDGGYKAILKNCNTFEEPFDIFTIDENGDLLSQN